jgi:hypothetical protein
MPGGTDASRYERLAGARRGNVLGEQSADAVTDDDRLLTDLVVGAHGGAHIVGQPDTSQDSLVDRVPAGHRRCVTPEALLRKEIQPRCEQGRISEQTVQEQYGWADGRVGFHGPMISPVGDGVDYLGGNAFAYLPKQTLPRVPLISVATLPLPIATATRKPLRQHAEDTHSGFSLEERAHRCANRH